MAADDDAEVRDAQTEKRLQALGKASAIDPERLTILSESQARLPNLGTEVTTYKVLDTESGESRRVALDGGDAQSTSMSCWRRASRGTRALRNLQEALHELVEARGDEDESLPVMLRYAVDEEPIDFDKRELDDVVLDDRAVRRAGPSRPAAASSGWRAGARRCTARSSRPTRSMRARRARPRVSGPFVRARVPLRALRELSRDERIAFIGLDEEKEVPDYPTIPQSLPTTRADTCTAAASGSGGEDRRPRVGRPVEAGGMLQHRRHAGVRTAANDHMTKSVGIIGNRYSAEAAAAAVAGLRTGRHRPARQRVRLPGPLRLGPRPRASTSSP